MPKMSNQGSSVCTSLSVKTAVGRIWRPIQPNDGAAPNVATDQAYALIAGTVGQQSAAFSYVDVFRWTALLAFFCAAAVWLFKKPVKHSAPPPGVH